MKVVLHYLLDSPSHRVLWLFEELKIPYELKVYHRDKWGNPPEPYRELHPVALKAPVIEIVDWQGARKKIVETGPIFSQLLSLFDTNNQVSFTSTKDKEQWDYYLHYVEASLMPVLESLMTDEWLIKGCPYGLQGIVRGVTSMIGGNYYAEELAKHLHYLETELQRQHQHGFDYFVGNKFSVADMMVAYPILKGLRYTQLFGRIYGPEFTMSTEYPHLNRYEKLMEMNPLLVRADEVLKEVQAKTSQT